MRKSLLGATGVSAVLLCAHVSLGQSRVLQFDLNNLGYQAHDSTGAASPFGGLTHTGTLSLFESSPSTELLAILISTGGGPFQNQAGAPWNLTDCALNINLTNGSVTGGNFLVDINGGPSGGGDRYSATVGSAGGVSAFIGGGFEIQGLSLAGSFSDATFGTVNVSDFFTASPTLTGSFLTFRVQPNPDGSGFADTDAFVSNVPSPGSIACLLAAACAIASRRRR